MWYQVQYLDYLKEWQAYVPAKTTRQEAYSYFLEFIRNYKHKVEYEDVSAVRLVSVSSAYSKTPIIREVLDFKEFK
jgi:hypothetical protein